MTKSIFFSFALTGEDKDLYTDRMQRLMDLAKVNKVEAYCVLNDTATDYLSSEHEKLMRAIEQLRSYDALVVIITSSRKSEGMLIEVGVALANGKPVYCLQHNSAVGSTYLPQLCNKTYVWNDEPELDEQLLELMAEIGKK